MGKGFELVDKQTRKALAISQLDIAIRIQAFLAETTLTIAFRNNTDRHAVEGEFQFTLDEGATISGFAVDVDGTMVDGVVITKEQAQVAFENALRATVAGKIATVEHIAGTVFKTRVYPVTASGRTVKIVYTSELSRDLYQLPLSFVDKVGKVSCQVAVQMPRATRADGAPTFEASADLTSIAPTFRFAKNTATPQSSPWSEFLATMSATSVSFRQGLTIRVPSSRVNEESLVEIEVSPEEASVVPSGGNQKDERQWFAFCALVSSLGKAGSSSTTTRKRASSSRVNFGILWDGSTSRRFAPKDLEFQSDPPFPPLFYPPNCSPRVIRGVIEAFGGSAAVSVRVFRNDCPTEGTFFDIASNQHQALIQYLEGVNYIGGTDFETLEAPNTDRNGPVDFYLLFSDGLATLGGEDLPLHRLDNSPPVFSICSDDKADFTACKLIARHTGASFFNISSSAGGSSEIRSAVARISGNQEFGFLGVTHDGQFEDISPSRPQGITGDKFLATGRVHVLPKSRVSLTLNFGFGTTVTEKRVVSLDIPAAKSAPSGLPTKCWAQRTMEDRLLQADASTKDWLLKFGRRNSLVTPKTSMIVLCDLSQYLKYEIEPPRTLSFHASYKRIMSTRKAKADRTMDQKMALLTSLWDRRVNWWNGDYVAGDWQEDIHHHADIHNTQANLVQVNLNLIVRDYELTEAWLKRQAEQTKYYTHPSETMLVDMAPPAKRPKLADTTAPSVDILEATFHTILEDKLQLLHLEQQQQQVRVNKPPAAPQRFNRRAPAEEVSETTISLDLLDEEIDVNQPVRRRRRERTMEEYSFKPALDEVPALTLPKELPLNNLLPLTWAPTTTEAVLDIPDDLAKIPSYSPTSPHYSPQSPSYSPSSAHYKPDDHEVASDASPASNVSSAPDSPVQSSRSRRVLSADLPMSPPQCATSAIAPMSPRNDLVLSAVMMSPANVPQDDEYDDGEVMSMSDDDAASMDEEHDADDNADEDEADEDVRSRSRSPPPVELKRTRVRSLVCSPQKLSLVKEKAPEPILADRPRTRRELSPPMRLARNENVATNIFEKRVREYSPVRSPAPMDTSESFDVPPSDIPALPTSRLSSLFAPGLLAARRTGQIRLASSAKRNELEEVFTEFKPARDPFQTREFELGWNRLVRLFPWAPSNSELGQLQLQSTSRVSDSTRKTFETLLETFQQDQEFHYDTGLLLELRHPVLAIRFITSSLELNLNDVQWMRMVAWKLEALGRFSDAVSLYQRILTLRSEEPQSYISLAGALIQRGKSGSADWQRAADLLVDVLEKQWDVRFTQVEIIAAMELNSLVAKMVHDEQVQNSRLRALVNRCNISVSTIPLRVDIRIVLQWNVDMTDLELHVFEPNDEHCSNFHNLTKNGGMRSKDMTNGLGPEEYLIRRATPGTYRVAVKLFASKSNAIRYGISAQVKIFLNFGDPDHERLFISTFRLKSDKETYNVAEIVW